MDKKSANKIVSETLEASFKKEAFIIFIKNLLNHIEEAPFVYRGNFIPDAYAKFISILERVGKYGDGENNIDILIVNLKKETSIERARTMQRNFIAWYLNGSRGGEMKDAALVAFVAPNQEDWRFSLVKMDYKFEETKDGKKKVKEVFTPARRWSFLVGKNENSHTAQSRLSPIVCDDEHNPTLEELEGAFNIEKVTKEFFEKYRELFLWVKESLDETIKKDRNVKQDFEAKGVNVVDFGKKLLGQIVFLYFLQKKGWFGVERDADWGTGPKNFLRELFEGKHGSYKNFFNETLEPLFYEALANGERPDNFYSKFNCKIPFLNGGLFDPINNYDWVHTDILLPNELFSNHYKTKEGDEGNGILDIFDRYNFTVKEDEPLEKEVAVDPEMMGKVFENLLEVKDRKSKGTYYTPREIVHYMCEQSLLNYLSTELAGMVGKEDIEKLIRHGELVIENELHTEENGKETKKYNYKLSESIRKNAKLIDEKLADIKVCDPAVGSGAFPVGMMTVIVNTRAVLSAYIKDGSRTMYDFKRDCIQNSLYGVDIDLGAVEIAKLRLWLSLVVDEDDIKIIKPLPNLDYKIMQGNSLMDEFEGVKLFDEKLLGTTIINAELFEPNNQRIIKVQSELLKHYISNPAWMKNKELERPQEVRNLEGQLHELLRNKKMIKETGYEQKDLFAEVAESREIRDELERLHKKFFEETSKNKKDELKQHIERLDWELIEITLKEQKKISALKKLEEFKQSNTKPFFLWKLNFADVFEKGGFDVVIANPPYNAMLSDKERSFFKKNYQSVKSGRQDTAAIFVERARQIGNNKMQFAYILPYRLFSRKRNHGQFQTYAVNNFSIRNIIYLGTDVDFSANDEFMILIMSADQIEDNLVKVAFKPSLKLLHQKDIFSVIPQKIFIDKNEINLNLVKFDPDLIKKIENDTVILNSICEVKDGIVPYIREKLISDKKIDSRYVSFTGIAGKYVLQKYFFSHVPLYLCYDINEAKKYISDKEELRKVQLRERSIFLNRKIISAQNCSNLKAAIDEDKTFVSNSIHSIYLQKEVQDNYVLEYVLALFNSTLLNYYHNFLRLKATDLHPQILVNDIKKLPIKEISLVKQKPFLKIVNKIMDITRSADYSDNSEAQAKVKEYEAEIDKMVYKLYSLKPAEIKIVESNK